MKDIRGDMHNKAIRYKQEKFAFQLSVGVDHPQFIFYISIKVFTYVVLEPYVDSIYKLQIIKELNFYFWRVRAGADNCLLSHNCAIVDCLAAHSII